MSPPLNLRCNDPAAYQCRGPGGRLSHRHTAGNAPRPLKGGNHLANLNQLDHLVTAIGHEHRSATPQALDVMGTTLVLHPIIRQLDRTQLHHAITRQAPNPRLAVVPGARTKNLGHALFDADQLHRLAPKNDAVLLRCQAQPQQKVGLAATSSATVENNVGIGVERRALRADLGNP